MLVISWKWIEFMFWSCDKDIKTWLFDKRPVNSSTIYGTRAEFTGAFIKQPCFNLASK